MEAMKLWRNILVMTAVILSRPPLPAHRSDGTRRHEPSLSDVTPEILQKP